MGPKLLKLFPYPSRGDVLLDTENMEKEDNKSFRTPLEGMSSWTVIVSLNMCLIKSFRTPLEGMSSWTLTSQNCLIVMVFKLKKYDPLKTVHINVCNALRSYPTF